MPSEQRGDSADSSANFRSEARLWATAGTLCNNVDAAEPERLALGPLFPKTRSYAFDAFRR